MTAPFRWEGVDRSGRRYLGRNSGDPVSFIEAKYQAGWRRLSVMSDTVPAAILGRIEKHQDTGRRIWWSA